MPTLSNLKIDLTLATAKFNAGVKSAKGGLSGIASQANLVKGALAGMAATAGLGVVVKQSIDAADALGKLSTRLGATVEGLSQLQYAASLTGVKNEELATAMQRSGRRIAEAAEGAGVAVTALDDLGLSAVKLAKLTPDQQFYALADALEEVEDQGKKTSLAMKLLDSGGVKLLQTFAGGSEQMAKYAQQADQLGITMSESTARAAEQFNDNLTVLGATNRGFINRITEKLLPTLNSLSGMMVAAATDTDTLNTAATVISGTLKSLASVGIVVAAAFKTTGDRIAATAAALAAAASGEFRQAFNILEAGAEDTVATTAETLEKLKALWTDSGADAAAAATRQRAAIIEATNAASIARTDDGGGVAVDKMTAAVDKQILALNAQAAALDMTETQAGLLKLTMAGATVEQLAAAEAAYQVIAAFKEQGIAAEEAARKAGELENVRQGLLSEREALQEHYELRRAIILENTTEEGEARANLLQKLDDKQRKDSKELDIKAAGERLGGIKEMFGNLAFLANNENAKLAEIGRSAAIIQATIDGYLAAQKALAQGGPIAGPAMAVTIGAMTAANIAGIAGARADGGPVTGGLTYLVGEKGPELFTPGVTGGITSNENMTAGGNITVNINEDASRAGQVERNGNELTVFVAAAKNAVFAEFRNGGNLARGVEKQYALTRRAG